MPAERLTRRGPRPNPGIVHLGPGAFFRAFNAIYTAEAMAAGGGDWGIIAVSLRSAGPRDQLAPQGCAYTSVELGPDGAKHRIIESVAECLVAPENPEAVLAAMCAPETRIVSLTVTEKGYCHNPAIGRLNPDHPDVRHDLTGAAPKSAPGYIVEALRRRRDAGLSSFTVLSCDNLPSNGHLAREIVLEFARLRDPALADWIAEECRFPATMVDRITPATTHEDIARLEEAKGYRDEAMVAHEPFRQWVIEDDFVQGRPAWDAAGAQFVTSVEAHELMKLRCLNGTHSTLAYLGYLAGYETIADTVADANFAWLCEKLWAEEILPTVPQPEGEDLAAYTAALLERYRNPAIRHRTWQIAMDGSQKLPQRILGTVADSLERGVVPKGLCLAVAGWVRYVGGVDESGCAIDVRDPLAEKFRAISDAAESEEENVARLLSVTEVFPASLAANAAFRAEVTEAYRRLARTGARQTVAEYVR